MILLSLVLITTVNVILRWEEAYFFHVFSAPFARILCISGGVVTEKKRMKKALTICVRSVLFYFLAVQGIMKYSSFSLQDFSLLIDVLP